MKSMTAGDPIISAITDAMSWHPSEGGPSYSEVRSKVEAVIGGEIERLRAALRECGADWKSSPGPVMGAAAELGREFKRRMQIACDVLSDEQSAPTKAELASTDAKVTLQNAQIAKRLKGEREYDPECRVVSQFEFRLY